MTRPSTLYAWATSANYAGGSAVGTPTRVAPSGGLMAEGYEPAQEPGAQQFNALVGNLFDWLAYLDPGATQVKKVSIADAVVANGAPAVHYAGGAADYWTFGANGDGLIVPLAVRSGQVLQDVSMFVQCGTTDVVTLHVFSATNVVGAASPGVGGLASAPSVGHAGLIEKVTATLPVTVASDDTTYYALVSCLTFATAPKYSGLIYTTSLP